MRVLVTDGDSRAALAITRSLGDKGHEVFVAAQSASSLASHSRFCHRALSYPDPKEDRLGFLDAIAEFSRNMGIDVLLPVTDVCLLPIIAESERFESICRLPFPSSDKVEMAADKVAICELAREVGVDIPQSTVVESVERSKCVEGSISYPVVIKPSKSRVALGKGWLATSVGYAHTTSELRQKLSELPAEAFPVLLQERVVGPGIGVFYCFNRGEVVATFAHRRIHEKPPSGGVSVLRESVEPHPLASEWGARLLRDLSWHGVAMVEFKLDQRDGRPKLMEINGRFWGSLQLAIDSGVDFPDLLVQIASGDSVDRIDEYRTGLRSRWFWGEIDILLLYLLKSREELKLPAGHDSRLLSILKVLNPFVRRQRLEVLRFSDPRPWFYETRQWFRN